MHWLDHDSILVGMAVLIAVGIANISFLLRAQYRMLFDLSEKLSRIEQAIYDQRR